MPMWGHYNPLRYDAYVLSKVYVHCLKHSRYVYKMHQFACNQHLILIQIQVFKVCYNLKYKLTLNYKPGHWLG